MSSNPCIPNTHTLMIRGETIGSVKIARSFLERLVGMAQIDPPSILFFPNCRFVHTLLPCHRLNIYFLDREGYLLSDRTNVARGRLCRESFASHVVESRRALEARRGDRFTIIDSAGCISFDFVRETEV